VALEEKKDKDFAAKFGLLGVEMDLSNVARGTLVVANTEKRKDELCQEIDGLIKSGTMRPGGGGFFQGQVWFCLLPVFR
jgi:hypothetical protein